MEHLSNVSVICACCNEAVALSNFTLSFHHCDTCEFEISRDMQRQTDIDEAEAEEMARYYGEDPTL